MVDRYAELYRSYRWRVPQRYNIAAACCGQWAAERSRFALYWEDESGASAAYSFWDIQMAANRLSNALAALGVKRGDRVALILPQRPEPATGRHVLVAGRLGVGGRPLRCAAAGVVLRLADPRLPRALRCRARLLFAREVRHSQLLSLPHGAQAHDEGG